MVKAVRDGSEFSVDRWDAPADDLERIEEGGRIDLERYGGIDRLRSELPGVAFQLARYRFGTVGPSNHFVELQRVEEILDPERAAQARGDRGPADHPVPRWRRGVHRRDRAALLPPQGLPAPDQGGERGAEALVPPALRPVLRRSSRRGSACTSPTAARHSPLASDEGQRLMLATAAAMNYGFAFRTATYAALRRIAADSFGGATGRLVVDSPHNSIYEEPVGNRTGVVHRHNSCRAFPAELMAPGTTFADTGQAVLLPGTHRTSSYLAVAGDRAATSLYSACHGAGTVDLRPGRPAACRATTH